MSRSRQVLMSVAKLVHEGFFFGETYRRREFGGVDKVIHGSRRNLNREKPFWLLPHSGAW